MHATSFPTNFASTMSWDPSLTYQETTAISDEARGELDKSLWGVGQNNIGPVAERLRLADLLGADGQPGPRPAVGTHRRGFRRGPLSRRADGGRVRRRLSGRDAPTGQPITPYLKVASTAKHYALNDVENNRHADSSDTTDANIRDYYTAQFKSLIEDSHVSGLMTSYNAINGTPAPANTYTANELAQRTYGFNGYTTSDCGAVGDVYSTGSHDWAPPGWTTSTSTASGRTPPPASRCPPRPAGRRTALRAGTQLNCTGAEDTLTNIQAGHRRRRAQRGRRSTTRWCTCSRCGCRPASSTRRTRCPTPSITKDQIQSPAHQALAETGGGQLARPAQERPASPATTARLLPADPASLNKVVIVGDLANKVTLGGYSGSPALQVNAVQGITSAIHAANPNASVIFDACGTSTRSTAAAACSAQTQTDIQSRPTW